MGARSTEKATGGAVYWRLTEAAAGRTATLAPAHPNQHEASLIVTPRLEFHEGTYHFIVYLLEIILAVASCPRGAEALFVNNERACEILLSAQNFFNRAWPADSDSSSPARARLLSWTNMGSSRR